VIKPGFTISACGRRILDEWGASGRESLKGGRLVVHGV